MGDSAPSSRSSPRVALAIGVAAGLGLGCGYLARSASFSASAGTATGPGGKSTKVSSGSATRSPSSFPAAARSSDTAASLLALTDVADFYTRLALWLPQADAGDCAAFWEVLAQRGTPGDPELANLFFARWAELDAPAAVAATKGTAYENAAWDAWARRDPRAAIAAAREDEQKWRVSRVLGSAARFHPDFGMRLLDENPELHHYEALSAIALAWADDQPERSLELLLAHDLSSGETMIAGLTRRDPHAALAWLREHPGKSSLIESLVKTLRQEDPAMLAEFAATAPSGKLKRLLEKAAFQYLASTDPDKALEMARSSEAPLIADERFVEIASGKLDAKDTQGALAILEEIYAKNTDSTSRAIRASSMFQLFGSLVKADAVGTMQVMARVDGDSGEGAKAYAISRPFNQAASAWARSDFPAFVAWVEQLPEGVSRSRAASVMSTQLMEQRRFAESMDWLGQTRSLPLDADTMSRVLGEWAKADAQAARSWFDGATLPEDIAKRLSRHFKPQP